MTSMKLSQLITTQLTSNIPQDLADLDVQNVCADTRKLKTGDVFVYDSRIAGRIEEFVGQAIKAEAAAIVVDMEGFQKLPAAMQLKAIPHTHPMSIQAKWMRAQYPKQPKFMAGVTGTNGKTSVAWFARTLMEKIHGKAASIGTLGTYEGEEKLGYAGYTTPSAETLYSTLEDLADRKVDHCCMEVSSHALALSRADGVEFAAAGFTNLSPDHRDFHGSMEAYFEAKLRLFTELLSENGTAVINVSRLGNLPAPAAAALMTLPKGRGCKVLTVGSGQAELVVRCVESLQTGLKLQVKYNAFDKLIDVPVVGSFQAENLAVAMGLCLAEKGVTIEQICKHLPELTSVPGRMEMLKVEEGTPAVVVDYAHTPDALEVAIRALRPQVKGKLWVVFGCGGNRDKAKRPLMGGIAAKHADVVVVTDDNPRMEDAKIIRDEVMVACPEAHNIGDRAEAILYAVENAAPEDTILVAGKGHEDGQIVGEKVLPFSDHEAALKALDKRAS